MNKNLLKICFVAALLIAANSVYAGSASLTGTTVIGGGTFSPSNKVTINVVSSGANYSAEAKHSAGNRLIGFNNNDPKMYYSEVAISFAVTTPSAATTEHSSWTSL